MLAIKEVGTVLFQLESRGYLELAGVMYVLELKVSFLPVSYLEDKGYADKFLDG